MKIGQYTLYIVTARKIEKYMNSGGTLFFYLLWRFILILTHTVNVASRFGGSRATPMWITMGIWILNRLWQLRLECPNNRWKLPRGNWSVLSVLRVLSVWSLANGRLECLNKRGLCAGKCSKGWRPEGLVEAAARELEGFKRFKGFKGLKPGKRQAWMP